MAYGWERTGKGEKLYIFADEYVVVDIETTGLSADADDIIEIAAIKVKNNQIIDSFSMLVKPTNQIPYFITKLTNITNEMVANAPCVKEGLIKFNEFIEDNIVYVHNAAFDINFIYDECKENGLKYFSNDYCCTLWMAKKLVKLDSYKLKDLKILLNLSGENSHRALDDVMLTFELIKKLKTIYDETKDIEDPWKKLATPPPQKLTDIKATKTIQEDNEINDKIFVFTGTLEKMSRAVATQLVLNHGGKMSPTINKKINYLVIATNDYLLFKDNNKTNKLKKAEEYIEKGLDINIIPEQVFYDMIVDYEV